MFERAAIVSALSVLVIFGLISFKYYQTIETEPITINSRK